MGTRCIVCIHFDLRHEMRKWIFTAKSQILQLSSLNVVVQVDGICCLLSVAIDRSVEPNRTGKRNKVNSTRNRRVELKVKYSCAVRKN